MDENGSEVFIYFKEKIPVKITMVFTLFYGTFVYTYVRFHYNYI